MSRLVAIVGQPNVGKSTLFNRLMNDQVSQAQAITGTTAGVTRDRHYGTVTWNDTHFTLIDTGGYLDHEIDEWSTPIRDQVHKALSEAYLVLLVGDCQQGCTPAEERLAQMLRQSQRPHLVVANKADNPKLALQAAEFYTLGLAQEVWPVSAVHGTGTADLLDEIVKLLPPAPAPVVTNLAKIAIIGRPNTGKSSILNLLLNEERSLVSKQAGTTRDALRVPYMRFGKAVELVDTAGMRKPSKVRQGPVPDSMPQTDTDSAKSRENIEFYAVLRALRALEHCDIAWILVDAKLGLQRQDMHLLNLAYDMGKGMIIVINKWDLIEKDTHTHLSWEKNLDQKLGALKHVPRIYCSVHTKQRVLKLVDQSIALYERRKQRLSTARINDWLQQQIAKNPPPAVRGHALKLNYITQTHARYPHFILFGNRLEIPKTYLRYLVNRLRKDFGFQGIRVALECRHK